MEKFLIKRMSLMKSKRKDKVVIEISESTSFNFSNSLIKLGMGEQMSACCNNKNISGHEVEINPFDKSLLDLPVGTFKPCSSLKPIDQGHH